MIPLYLKPHIKGGQLGRGVTNVTFLDQRRSVKAFLTSRLWTKEVGPVEALRY